MVTPPILDNKNALMPSVFVPTALLREARRQKSRQRGGAADLHLDPDGDLVRHLRRNASANSFSGWPCYHTELDTFDLGGQQVGIVGRVVGASVGSRAALRPATIGEVSAYDFCAHSVAMTNPIERIPP